nr:retrovirus-related Pol polyprotein from transposon TNT 1-94 [Tanacetum cinerariifolium]
MEAIRIVLAYVADKSFIMFQMDVKIAFLHGTLKEDVYVCQPKGVIDAVHPSHVYKLKKALNGLNQAPRAHLHKSFAMRKIQLLGQKVSKIKDYFSYQFKLDKKKCRVDVEVFRDILQISHRLPNQEFVEPHSSDEEIVSFIKELGYKGDIESVTEVITDHMHQPWRTFTAVINRCFSGKTIDRQQKHQFYKKGEYALSKIHKAIIQHFISKDKSISMRNRLFMHTVQYDSILGSLKFVSKTDDYQAYRALIPIKMTNLKMRNSPAYMTFLAYATGAIPPKKARKFKKHASPSKKKPFVAVEEPVEKPAKKPAARLQSTSVQIRDTLGVSVSKKKAPAKDERSKGIELMSEAALLEEALLKKAIKRNKRETDIHQASGLSEGAGLESDVLDEPKGISIDTSEGTSLKPGVPDVSKADSFESDDDEEETQEDEYVHTPEDYVPTNDETNDIEGDGKDDEEMTDVGHVDAEHENVNQDIAENKVKTLRNVGHSSAIHAAIKSGVLTVVKEYLGTSLDDALCKFKKPKRPPTLDDEWNKCKIVDNKPTQKWLSGLTEAEKPSKIFNDLMSTLIDFSTFAMNRLQTSDLTQDILVGRLTSFSKVLVGVVELEYNMKERYKALNDQLDWNNLEGDRHPFDLSMPLPLVQSRNHQIVLVDYFFNNDLAYLHGESTDRRYTTSLTKAKATKCDLLFNLKGGDIVHLAVTLFLDKLKAMANKLELGYHNLMLRRRWSNLDKKRSRIMMKDIDRQLLERRLMRSLEKFIGGREYGEDLRLL